MIQYIKHSDIDFEKWDHCISKSINASYTALSDVLDITCSNWDCLVYGDYQAVFPLPWRRKMGLKYIYPPFFSTQLGLYSPTEMDVLPFIESIPKDFKYIEIKSNTSFKTPSEVPIMKRNRTYYLDLKPAYDELFANFSKNHKQNVRKSEDVGLTLSKHGDITSIIDLFQTNQGSIASFNSSDYQNLHKLMTLLRSDGKVEVWSVFDETNTLCAGGFFIFEYDKIHFLFSGSNAVAKEQKAMFFLFAQFIKEHANSEKILDFGGSNNDNLARFYHGFGSVDNFYDTICVDRLPKVFQWIKNMKKIIKK